MDYQRDSGQKFSKQLRTTSENTSASGLFAQLTYYVKGLRSSVTSIFIAKVDGVRNRTAYAQGELVVTMQSNSPTKLSVVNGSLLLTCPPEETYQLDGNGYLICTTVPKT